MNSVITTLSTNVVQHYIRNLRRLVNKSTLFIINLVRESQREVKERTMGNLWEYTWKCIYTFRVQPEVVVTELRCLNVSPSVKSQNFVREEVERRLEDKDVLSLTLRP